MITKVTTKTLTEHCSIHVPSRLPKGSHGRHWGSLCFNSPLLMPIASLPSLLATTCLPQNISHLLFHSSHPSHSTYLPGLYIAVLVSNQVEMLLLMIHWLRCRIEHLMSYKIDHHLFVCCSPVVCLFVWLFFTSLIIKISSGSPKDWFCCQEHKWFASTG